jgi:predicted phosphoribosyltransferase
VNPAHFRDREDAGSRLGAKLAELALHDPLVLAIPRGGVEVGAAIARALGAELDVVLSRKLRAPSQPELALGAVSEGGEVYLNRAAVAMTGATEANIDEERRRQLEEIGSRAARVRAVRDRARIEGRSVVLTDDGLATGSTMIAGLRTVREQSPRELICAVPVAPPDRLEEVGRLCDRVVCLAAPEQFWAVGQFYADFTQVSDERVVELLTEFGGTGAPRRAAST